MIEIKFNPKELSLELSGHAGQAEKGKDIVCSAVSILFYTLCQAVIDSREMLEEDAKVVIDDGNGFVSCKPKKPFLSAVQRTYWTVLTGFELLAEQYKEYISFDVDKKI